jgi:hypothetical protein
MSTPRDDPRERLEFHRPAALPGTEMMAAYESSQPWHVFHERYAFCVCHAVAAGVRLNCTLPTIADKNGWKLKQPCGGELWETGDGPDMVRECTRCGAKWSTDSKED